MQTVNHFYRIFNRNPSSKMHLLFLYRTSSLLLTSLFFYFLGPQSPFIFKIGIIGSLCLAAWIISDLQKRHVANNKVLILIVSAETIGLTLLLIPTGGISSLFIWYALNPVLSAAILLTPLFCLSVLTFYLGSATLIAHYLFHIDFVMILQEKSYFYLVCLLTTVLVQLFSGLTRELDLKASLLKVQQKELLQVNNKLVVTNEKYQETLEHIMSLYHLIGNLSSNKSPEKLIKEITTSLYCTQSTSAFYWLTNLNHQNSYLANSTTNFELEMDLKKKWNNFRTQKDPFTSTIRDELFLMKIIRTSNHVGVLGIKVSSKKEVEKNSLLNHTFEFLSELSVIMLERIQMDKIMNETLVIEEQNRIANDIHDSVSQRLFGIVYSLHNLQVKSNNLTKEELNEEYKFLSESANTTIKELRAAIYRLSSVKNGEKPFLFRIKAYLVEYAKLNNVRINYRITGDESLASDELKNSLYRIICEACGNAVRHGECNVIDLNLTILDEQTSLLIQDDGLGINLTLVKEMKDKGIGLLNMRRTVAAYSGTFSIKGKPSLGTEIKIDIPNTKIPNEKEVAGL